MKTVLAALLLAQATAFGQTVIPLVYDKECMNDNYQIPEMPSIDKLPEIATLPDPLHGLTEVGDQRILKIGNVAVLK